MPALPAVLKPEGALEWLERCELEAIKDFPLAPDLYREGEHFIGWMD